MFGGQGSRQMLRIAEQLPGTPLILLCGHNRALADALRAQPANAPHVVVEHTQDVAGCMRLGDFFIGKPGPGSLSEAWKSGLPVIVTRNAWTMPQERYNTEFVREQGLGLVLKSFGAIAPAVTEMVRRLPEFRQRLRGHDNRAVFEVPAILAGILEAVDMAPAWLPPRPQVAEPTLAD
jgi:UDP-N-acetylglucosamine:LPS N-acetylglucosamine transferase